MTADASKDVETEKYSSIVGGIASLYNHSGNQSGVPQKIGHSTTGGYCNIFLGIYPEDDPMGKKYTCSTMFLAALFIIARIWKEPRCPSTEEWIQKMWYIYTTEYYILFKNDKFMNFAGKWMEPETIILSDITQIHKYMRGMYPLISA